MKIFSTLFIVLFCVLGRSQSHNGSSTLNGGFTLYQSATEGHAFLLDDFSIGNLIDSQGVVSETKMFNYDIYNNIVFFKTGNDKDALAVKNENYTGFILKPANQVQEYIFKKIDGSDFDKVKKETKFYQIVKASSNYVITEYIKNFKDPNSSGWVSSRYNNEGGEYKLITNYYLLDQQNKYVEVKLNKKAILKTLKDKKKELEQFIDKNNIEFNSVNDLIPLAEYYHSL